MNPNESELEQQLRTLRPIAPSPTLADAIARELKSRDTALALRLPTAGFLVRPTPRAFPGILRGLGWACAGACVAVAAIFAIESGSRQTQPVAAAEPAPAFDLAESSAEILTAQDEGVIYSDIDAPVRRIRYNSIERHVWTDAHTGARMEMEIPREDIRFMPVAMQ